MPQYARLEWEGRRVWTKRGKRAAARGLQKAAEFVLAESNKIVPLEEGTLERSGKTDVDEGTLNASISYDTPYAVRQHEELTWKHAPGRQAKYLETALNVNRQETLRLMQSELRIWLR